MSFQLRHCHRCSFQSKVDRNMYPALFLLYRKLRRISYKAKKRSMWIALRRNRKLSLRDPPQAENPAMQDSIFNL